MKNSQNKKTLQIVLLVLIAVLTIGIGYASISAVNLIINGSATANPGDNNFKVKFLNETGVTPTIEGAPDNTVSVLTDTTASFNVTTLNGAGQSVTATYRVKNVSNGIGASIDLNLTNSNPDYFKVTETILDHKLQAGEETTVTVKVEMLKTPVESAVSTNITATLVATPIEDAEATGGRNKTKVEKMPYVYSIATNTINSEITGQTYQSFLEAKAAFNNKGLSIAHILNGTTIKESYVAFEYNNEIYYLRGGVDETQQTSPVYEENKDILKSAFGSNWSNYCSETVGSNYKEFECYSNTIDIYINYDGTIQAGKSSVCSIDINGQSSCTS